MKIEPKYLRIAKRLTHGQLQADTFSEALDLEGDLFPTEPGQGRPHLFLGFYSENGIRTALTKYGIYDLLRDRGFANTQTVLDTRDAFHHRLTLYETGPKTRFLIAELVLKKEILTLDLPFEHPLQGRRLPVLAIDWCILQNPHGRFTRERPQLPGQEHPGLGVAKIVLELLLLVCRRLHLAGIFNVPAYYHAALFYSRVFHFLDPRVEARLLALQRDLREHSLQVVSWGLEWSCVEDRRSAARIGWIKAPQLLGINEEVAGIFGSQPYRQMVAAHTESHAFALDQARMAACKRDFPSLIFPVDG